jgi:hypothetical protein
MTNVPLLNPQQESSALNSLIRIVETELRKVEQKLLSTEQSQEGYMKLFGARQALKEVHLAMEREKMRILNR